MSGFTLKHLPPENEQDFERLCLHLLRGHWKSPDLQMYGRRGQEQNGVDILDLAGRGVCRGAQCKNFNPLQAFSVKDLNSSVEAARSFRPSLDRLEIMTTAKKSTDTQLEVYRINQDHREKGLFRVRLKTWDEIELLLSRYPKVSEQVYGAGLWTVISELADQVRVTARQVEAFSGRLEPAPPSSTIPQFNSVLVRWNVRLIAQTDGAEKIMLQDFSILLLTIEELISLGAIELALDFVPGEFPGLLDRIPAPLRNRVRYVGDPNVRKSVESILSPVYEEFEVESIQDGLILQCKDVGEQRASFDLVTIVRMSLYDFLIGAKNYLQIDLDLEAFHAAVRELRYRSRSADSRANLAVLEGILSTYKGQHVECIGLRSSASAEAVTHFNQFAGIESYRNLSRTAQGIGFPERSHDALNSFSEASRNLVSSPELRETLVLGSRRIVASQGIEQGDRLRIVRPESGGFLPPIVSFEAARTRALEVYKNLQPKPLVHDEVRKYLRENRTPKGC